MEWLGSNWIWLALMAGFFGFLAFGRGSCGMSHGGQGHHQGSQADRRGETPVQGALRGDRAGNSSGPSEAGGHRHRHGCC